MSDTHLAYIYQDQPYEWSHAILPPTTIYISPLYIILYINLISDIYIFIDLDRIA